MGRKVRPNTPETCPLTSRQLEILVLTAEGLSGKQIGQRLRKSASTVRSLQHQAYERLRVSNVTSAVIKCARAGWIDIGGANPNEAAQQVKLEKLLTRLV